VSHTVGNIAYINYTVFTCESDSAGSLKLKGFSRSQQSCTQWMW